MKVLLAVENIAFRYGARPVLEGISFLASAGEFLCLLGNNGAGKSTLLDLLAGLRSPESGQVCVAGRPLPAWSAAELARCVSHLPQAVSADLPFTAGQLVAMGRYPHTDRWFESPEDEQEVQRAMERTGCGAWKDRPLRTLSGGERQRVALAAVLAQRAEILLLDEPSTFLDIAQQIACFELLREEAGQGRLCVAVTHDLNLALRFATRLLVLSGGQLTSDLSAAEAARSAGWLQPFSSRLTLEASSAGATPWISYR